MGKKVLELKNVSKSFGKRKIIDNLNLEVEEGEIYGFLGPNGSGKTTTIKMILKGREKDKVGKYSLGMKQRLGLALTLLHKPKVLILDEPTNGLDPAGIKKLRDILKEISHKEGVAVFVSSHILSEMQLMCDRVAVLDNGKIVKVEKISDTNEEKEEVVVIKVRNIEKAVKILKEEFNLDVKIENNKINITVRTEKLPEVIKKLAIADTEIQLVIPKEHTLEDIFFDATERGVK